MLYERIDSSATPLDWNVGPTSIKGEIKCEIF